MDENAPVFQLKHIGINHPDESSAMDTAAELCRIFNLQMKDNMSTHVFAGSLFEVKKNCEVGKLGHIGLRVADMDAALTYLEGKGVHILPDTVRRDESGNITFAYLDIEIAGFAFHVSL